MVKVKLGQSLFEVVVAIGVAAVIVVALVSLVTRSIRNATFSKNKSLAASYAQEASEWLRGERDNNLIVFLQKSATGLTYCLPTADWPVSAGGCGSANFIQDTQFLRSVTFSRTWVVVNGSNKDIITADIRVSWNEVVE